MNFCLDFLQFWRQSLCHYFNQKNHCYPEQHYRNILSGSKLRTKQIKQFLRCVQKFSETSPTTFNMKSLEICDTKH